jgi:hypothetical protein
VLTHGDFSRKKSQQKRIIFHTPLNFTKLQFYPKFASVLIVVSLKTFLGKTFWEKPRQRKKEYSNCSKTFVSKTSQEKLHKGKRSSKYVSSSTT